LAKSKEKKKVKKSVLLVIILIACIGVVVLLFAPWKTEPGDTTSTTTTPQTTATPSNAEVEAFADEYLDFLYQSDLFLTGGYDDIKDTLSEDEDLKMLSNVFKKSQEYYNISTLLNFTWNDRVNLANFFYLTRIVYDLELVGANLSKSPTPEEEVAIIEGAESVETSNLDTKEARILPILLVDFFSKTKNIDGLRVASQRPDLQELHLHIYPLMASQWGLDIKNATKYLKDIMQSPKYPSTFQGDSLLMLKNILAALYKLQGEQDTAVLIYHDIINEAQDGRVFCDTTIQLALDSYKQGDADKAKAYAGDIKSMEGGMGEFNSCYNYSVVSMRFAYNSIDENNSKILKELLG